MNGSVLQRIARGDPDAVRECIQEYSGLVWSLARRLSRSPSDAEDATQEIFLDIWRSAGRFDAAQGSDKVFIATIARRRLIDRIRRAKSRPQMEPLEVLDFMPAPDTTPAADANLDVEQVAGAFAKLRAEYRSVLELSLLSGLSHSEIAEKLNMPLGTVKSFMRRGLIQVREFMNVPAVGAEGRTDV